MDTFGLNNLSSVQGFDLKTPNLTPSLDTLSGSEFSPNTLKNKVPNPDEIKKENIEKLPGRTELKGKIEKDKEKAKALVKEAKPKIIIKIPKPFAKGYFIIDISAMLEGLLGAALALLSKLALGLIMSKLSKILGDLMNKKLEEKGSIDSNDVNSAVNSVDLSKVVNESIDEEKMMAVNSLNNDGSTLSPQSEIGINGTYGNDSVVVDSPVKQSVSKISKRQSNKEEFTFNKRNRTDLLNSDSANNRLTKNNRNKRAIDNPNYGKYT
jgi:hypothetical protein